MKVTQDGVTRRVTVTYDLDEPAIVTMDVLTNGVSIGDANLHYVSGDCNKLVKEGEGRTLYWNPEKAWPGYKFTTPVVTVKLTAWATNAPPDYMVVDLATSGNVSFYTSEDALPGGLLKNEAYRRTKLVMRKIHQPASGKWTMGVSAELGKYNLIHNLVGVNPLIGPHVEEWGARFPDMSEVYTRRFAELLHASANRLGLRVMDGVYAYTSGPCYETPAEIRMVRTLGGDAVGMSTVPEVIVANHCGMRCFGMSIITDLGGFGEPVKVTHEEVQRAASAVQPLMATIMEELVKSED